MSPIPYTPFIISLMGCIYLSIFSKKLKAKTVTTIEYLLWISIILGILILLIVVGNVND